MAKMFRLLRADKIECRVGQTKAGKGLKVFISPKSWYSQLCTMVVICLQDSKVTFVNKTEE